MSFTQENAGDLNRQRHLTLATTAGVKQKILSKTRVSVKA